MITTFTFAVPSNKSFRNLRMNSPFYFIIRTTLAMINIAESMAIAIRATVPESLSDGCDGDCSVFDWLFPATFTSTENEQTQ